jgi:hypothetical protein
MAKRVNKSSKQTAATRRTKKTTTPVKKAPVKKSSTTKKTVSKTPVKKTPMVTPSQKNVVKKRTVRSGKNLTVKTTLAEITKTQPKITPSRPKIKINQSSIIKISEDESSERFSEIGEQVKKKKLKWLYYAVVNGTGHHHYQKL